MAGPARLGLRALSLEQLSEFFVWLRRPHQARRAGVYVLPGTPPAACRCRAGAAGTPPPSGARRRPAPVSVGSLGGPDVDVVLVGQAVFGAGRRQGHRGSNPALLVEKQRLYRSYKVLPRTFARVAVPLSDPIARHFAAMNQPPPGTPPREASTPNATTAAAKIALVGTIMAAIIGATATITAALVSRNNPTPMPPRPPPV